MSIPDKIDLGPAMSLMAALGLALSNLSGLASAVGISPFAADVLGTLVFGGASLHWFHLALALNKRKIRAGFLAGAEEDAWPGLREKLPFASIAVALSAISIWFAVPVVSKLIWPSWKICGTLSGRCSASACVFGLDKRLRPISDVCTPLDSSGYLVMHATDYSTYAPASLRIQCEGKQVAVVQLPPSFSDARCNGTLDIP